jgi:DNA integrity scanning protein DisA with diadenylate cyclase activity
MNIAALYVHDIRHVLLDPEELASRASQALATLERYRARLEEVAANLTALEVEDQATAREVAAVAGRQEMVWRIAEEIADVLAELGTAGRLLRLQFEEAIAGIEQERRLLVRDYAPAALSQPPLTAMPAAWDIPTSHAGATGHRDSPCGEAVGPAQLPSAGRPPVSAANTGKTGNKARPQPSTQSPSIGNNLASDPEQLIAGTLAGLAMLPATALIEPETVATTLRLIDTPDSVDTPLSPLGFRLLSKVPGLDSRTTERIVARFGHLQAILSAPLEDLTTVQGMGRARARAIREGLSRIAETASLERFV